MSDEDDWDFAGADDAKVTIRAAIRYLLKRATGGARGDIVQEIISIVRGVESPASPRRGFRFCRRQLARQRPTTGGEPQHDRDGVIRFPHRRKISSILIRNTVVPIATPTTLGKLFAD
jgi:hypothetical protein